MAYHCLQEDVLLKRLVESFGPQKWSVIAEKIKVRGSKAQLNFFYFADPCARLSLNHVHPDICRDALARAAGSG